MAFIDGKGNSIEVDNSFTSRLNGADVIFFGDSNVQCSAGSIMSDVGSFYYRLAKEFDINSWQNMGVSGNNTHQGWLSFNRWATEEMVARYNKESTVFLFWYGTNDERASWEHEFDEAEGYASTSVWSISKLISEKFPKAFYAWVIPPVTDWTKWQYYSEETKEYYAARNMAEKVPLMVTNLNMWNFPYCDMFHQSGITPAILSDGVHLGGGTYDYTTDAVYRAYRTLREYLMTK